MAQGNHEKQGIPSTSQIKEKTAVKAVFCIIGKAHADRKHRQRIIFGGVRVFSAKAV